ncbi:hypothetical protein Droror1_Dr00025013 [Drosera rotundifolia]
MVPFFSKFYIFLGCFTSFYHGSCRNGLNGWPLKFSNLLSCPPLYQFHLEVLTQPLLTSPFAGFSSPFFISDSTIAQLSLLHFHGYLELSRWVNENLVDAVGLIH